MVFNSLKFTIMKTAILHSSQIFFIKSVISEVFALKYPLYSLLIQKIIFTNNRFIMACELLQYLAKHFSIGSFLVSPDKNYRSNIVADLTIDCHEV